MAAFNRKNITAIPGITAEQVDAIMTLHGASLSDYVTKADAEAAQQQAIANALANAPKPTGADTEEYKALEKQFNQYKTAQQLASEFGVKSKFAETVAAMLEDGKETADQIEEIKGKYEEYFNPTETEPDKPLPVFGTEPKGAMPTGNSKPTLSDIWFGKK